MLTEAANTISLTTRLQLPLSALQYKILTLKMIHTFVTT